MKMEDTNNPGVSDAAKQRPTYAGNAAINPKVPYCHKLTTFVPGDILIISGQILPSCKNFSINLQEMVTGMPVQNIFLRLDVRLGAGVIIRNNKTAQGWQSEERSGGLCGLENGKPFECMIMLHRDFFKIAFNGEHLSDFEHRSPYNQISHVNIEGNIELYSVQVQEGPARTDYKTRAMPSAQTIDKTKEHKSVQDKIESEMNEFPETYGVTLPYSEFIPGGMRPPRVLYISLIPAPRADQFVIELKPGRVHSQKDIALHFKVMMREKVVVLNSKQAKWGKEEKITNRFPFRSGVHYDVMILCVEDHYRISVNNQHFTDYKHRMKQLDTITGLEITGAAKIVHIRLF